MLRAKNIGTHTHRQTDRHADINSAMAINGLAKRIIRPAKQSADLQEETMKKKSKVKCTTTATVETLTEVNNRSSQVSLGGGGGGGRKLNRMTERLLSSRVSES